MLGRISPRMMRAVEAPAASRRGDVVERAHLLGRAAHHDGEAVPFEQAEHQDHDPERAADDGDDGERDQDHRHRQPRRDQEGHEHVDPAAEIAGEQAEGRADQAGDHASTRRRSAARCARRRAGARGSRGRDCRCRADAARCPCSYQNGGTMPARQILRVGIVRREQRREQRDEHDAAPAGRRRPTKALMRRGRGAAACGARRARRRR